MQNLSHRDLITILLRCEDSNGVPMFSKQQIRAQLFTFLFAGLESTSSAIESLIFQLGDEPGWTRKIAEEFEVCNKPFVTVFEQRI